MRKNDSTNELYLIERFCKNYINTEKNMLVYCIATQKYYNTIFEWLWMVRTEFSYSKQ